MGLGEPFEPLLGDLPTARETAHLPNQARARDTLRGRPRTFRSIRFANPGILRLNEVLYLIRIRKAVS
jgi:hypothetical protein